MRKGAGLRLVLDTNVVVSGLIWGGVPGKLLLLADNRQVGLFTSDRLLAELADVLGRPKFGCLAGAKTHAYSSLLNRYRTALQEVVLRQVERVVPSDPDDDAVIATAVAARADIIATGDQDLLALHPYRGIAITPPAEALRRVRVALSM